MVKEGIVLGHMISTAGLEVDKAKVSIIKNLLPPTTVKGIRSFLGHAGFYRRFIRDFSKVARPLCRLLEKNTKFKFDESCQRSNQDWLKLPSWPNQIGIKNLKSCVMPVIMQWELYWDRELTRCLGPYTMPAKLSMKLKKSTLLLKKRCCNSICM